MKNENSLKVPPLHINKLKILSVLQLLGHPRDSKRIAMLQQAGFEVEVAAFERPYHSGRLPDCQVEVLGSIAHGQYLQRIEKLIRAMPTLRRAIHRNDLVYASGQDMAYLALIAGLGLRKPVVLEVGDINQLQVAPGIWGAIFRMIDKFLTNRCSLLVSTTPSFISEYYRKWLGVGIEAIVIENKLEPDFVRSNISNLKLDPLRERPFIDRPLRIGYFGLLRCQWCWQVLETLAKVREKEVEIVLAGYPMNPADLLKQVEKYDNIKYLGEYRSPQDLPSLYGSVDLVWACYEPIGPNDWNLRWARTNRFYESCFFQKPIISRYGSCDAISVDSYEIGLTINDDDVDKVVEKICRIGLAELENWQHNIAALPLDVYTYTQELDTLKNTIELAAGSFTER